MRGSQVATNVAEKVAASSFSSSPSLKRGSQEALSELQQEKHYAFRQDEDGSSRIALIAAERTWFSKRVCEGLIRARNVLKAINNSVLDGEDEVERLGQLTSLKELLAALPGIAGQVFRTWFTDDEWQELQKSEACISSESHGQLRTLRLKRQKQLLDASCEVAIDLTVRDEEGDVNEQSALVLGCTTAVQVLLNKVHMNSRGLVKRVVKTRTPPLLMEMQEQEKAVSVASSKAAAGPAKKNLSGSSKRSAQNNDVEVADKNGEVQQMLAKDKRRRKGSKADLAEQVEDDGNGSDEGVGGDVVAAPQLRNEEVEEGVEVDEKEGKEGGDFESLFERAREDVTVVARMLHEARKGGDVNKSLDIGSVKVPDSKLTSQSAGKGLWDDEEKLKRCLDCAPRDEGSALENWGVLLKWWRIVERVFSITGLFAHLRGMRGKRALPERYALARNRLKRKGGKALSFKQAEKYDRLGKFLLQFPRFVFQIQLVSLADWHQKCGEKILMDSLEGILDVEQVQFWQNPIPPVVNHEEGLSGVLMVPAITIPSCENVWPLREYASALDPDGVLTNLHGDPSGSLVFDSGEQDLLGNSGSVPALASLSLSTELPVGEEEQEEDVEEDCSKCGSKGKVVFLECDGPGKSHIFCWKCDGYSSAPAEELHYPGSSTDVSVRTYVFCAEHLKLECCTRPFNQYLRRQGSGDGLLKISDFINHVQAEEARQMVQILSDPKCRFSIVPIDPNGWCMFVSVAKALKVEWSELVHEMKGFAREYLKKEENVASINDLGKVRSLWNKLDPINPNSVQPFWTSEAADFLIHMMALHLNSKNEKAVQIRVWMIENGTLEMTKLVYPDGRAEEFRYGVDLLKSNVVVEHYDLLVNKTN